MSEHGSDRERRLLRYLERAVERHLAGVELPRPEMEEACRHAALRLADDDEGGGEHTWLLGVASMIANDLATEAARGGDADRAQRLRAAGEHLFGLTVSVARGGI